MAGRAQMGGGVVLCVFGFFFVVLAASSSPGFAVRVTLLPYHVSVLLLFSSAVCSSAAALCPHY